MLSVSMVRISRCGMVRTVSTGLLLLQRRRLLGLLNMKSTGKFRVYRWSDVITMSILVF